MCIRDRSKALDINTLTIGFARRAATYKRAQLLFHDMDRLIEIGHGKIQVVFSGKAHPKDQGGKKIIQEIVSKANDIQSLIEDPKGSAMSFIHGKIASIKNQAFSAVRSFFNL